MRLSSDWFDTIATRCRRRRWTVGIACQPIPTLGGLRERQRGIPPEANAFWENESLRNCVDYAVTKAFASALGELYETGKAERCAIMRAEALWWRRVIDASSQAI